MQQITVATDREIRRFGAGGGVAGALARRRYASGGWSPPDPAHLQLWMNAQVPASVHVTGGGVDSWTDQSQNGFTATDVTGAGSRALYTATGPMGKSVVDMVVPGVGAQLGVPDAPALNATTLTVFFAGVRTTGASNSYAATIAKTNEGAGNLGWSFGHRASSTNFELWLNNDTSGGFSTSFTPTPDVYFCAAARYNGTTISIWQGQTKLADVAYAVPISNTNGQVGVSTNGTAGPHTPWVGKFLETSFYNTALSDFDVGSWLSRFHTDYGI